MAGKGGLKSTSFKPGHKGIGGRPTIPVDVREAARAYTADALKTLKDAMHNKKAPVSAKVMAAQALLDRGHGKPTQHVEANVNFLDTLGDAEQRGLAAALAALTGEQEEAGPGTETTH